MDLKLFVSLSILFFLVTISIKMVCVLYRYNKNGLCVISV